MHGSCHGRDGHIAIAQKLASYKLIDRRAIVMLPYCHDWMATRSGDGTAQVLFGCQREIGVSSLPYICVVLY